ncbi:hypothetical protein HKX48_002520 [Thoreauomyces humboldtii]|nr:hypothetical protein HKX48_002520 [Thoreauomyces humboldtii]
MSAPVERAHYPALVDAGVGLIVNLTESFITPDASIMDPRKAVCRRCDYRHEPYPRDLFDDLGPADDLQVLFLPMPDGSVPSYSQLQLFNTHARDFIERGKKVLVHCQAGVGRTGTFLAVYLMEKYRYSPEEALSDLRLIRPQSLRFHRTDWATEPFRLHEDEGAYDSNLLQERFIWRYWDTYIRDRSADHLTDEKETALSNANPSSVATPISVTASHPGPRPNADIEMIDMDGDILDQGQTTNDAPRPLEHMGKLFLTLVDAELDSRMAHLEQLANPQPHPPSSSPDRSSDPVTTEKLQQHHPTSTPPLPSSLAACLCFPCRGILSVGPLPVKPQIATASAAWSALVGDSNAGGLRSPHCADETLDVDGWSSRKSLAESAEWVS